MRLEDLQWNLAASRLFYNIEELTLSNVFCPTEEERLETTLQNQGYVLKCPASAADMSTTRQPQASVLASRDYDGEEA